MLAAITSRKIWTYTAIAGTAMPPSLSVAPVLQPFHGVILLCHHGLRGHIHTHRWHGSGLRLRRRLMGVHLLAHLIANDVDRGLVHDSEGI